MASDNRRRHRPRRRPKRAESGEFYWIWGRHTVLAALRNPKRQVLRLIATPESHETALEALSSRVSSGKQAPDSLETDLSAAKLGPDALHQGIAALVKALPAPDRDLLAAPGPALVVALDQVSDPRNFGAILRNCAVMGATAVVTPRDHAPGETGVVAKTASGALEVVPVHRVPNLARSLEALKGEGYFVLGLDSQGTSTIAEHAPIERAVLVAGAEGKGLRPLVRRRCDVVVSLPVAAAARDAGIDSLNVATAIAVALHDLVRFR